MTVSVLHSKHTPRAAIWKNNVVNSLKVVVSVPLFEGSIKKSAYIRRLIYLILVVLRVHRGDDKFFKFLRNRNQIVIDHDILRVNGVNMIHIYNV